MMAKRVQFSVRQGILGIIKIAKPKFNFCKICKTY